MSGITCLLSCVTEHRQMIIFSLKDTHIEANMREASLTQQLYEVSKNVRSKHRDGQIYEPRGRHTGGAGEQTGSRNSQRQTVNTTGTHRDKTSNIQEGTTADRQQTTHYCRQGSRDAGRQVAH